MNGHGLRSTAAIALLSLAILAGAAEAIAAQLTLTWADASSDELGFSIERRVGTTGAFSEVDTVGANVTTYVDTGLTSGTTYCYRVSSFNSAGYSAGYTNTACGVALDSASLAVLKVGTGSGSVTSNPAGITCGATCSGSYTAGTSVILTAAPAVGSTFAGWSGGGCSGTGPCAVTVQATTVVTATFEAQPGQALSVAPASLAFVKVVGQANPPAQTVTVTAAAGQAWTTHDTMSFADVTGLPFNGVDGVNGIGPNTFQVVPSSGMTSLPAGVHTSSIRVSTAGSADIVIPVQVTVTSQAVTLSVARTGAGTGTVTSSPAGISCGATCTSSFAAGSSVTLSAAPATGSSFAGWSGGGCSGTGACTVSLNAATSVTASFSLAPVTLSVARTGAGTGTVTSSPAGISCGATCTSSFAAGSSVTLSAAPAAGSSFAGWSGGGCSGTGACTVTLNAATSVTASFALLPAPPVTLTVAKAGAGSGGVSSSPAGINCGTTCSTSFAAGTAVTLSAAPGAGSSFAGWSGGGCSGTSACTVTLNAATSVTASFALLPAPPVTLTVTKAGAGSGGVSSSPAGINCGSTCAWSYPAGSVLTLSATAHGGSSFAGWSGACSGTGSCTVTLTAATTVTASFSVVPTASVTDDFERPNSTVVGNGWTEARGNFSIWNGKLWTQQEPTRHLAMQESVAMAAGRVSADFTFVSGGGPSFGLVFGYRDRDNYFAAYRRAGGTSVLRIVRVVGGVEQVIATQPCPNARLGRSFQLTVSFGPDRIETTVAGKTVTASGVTVSPGWVGVMVDGGRVQAIDNFAATP